MRPGNVLQRFRYVYGSTCAKHSACHNTVPRFEQVLQVRQIALIALQEPIVPMQVSRLYLTLRLSIFKLVLLVKFETNEKDLSFNCVLMETGATNCSTCAPGTYSTALGSVLFNLFFVFTGVGNNLSCASQVQLQLGHVLFAWVEPI